MPLQAVGPICSPALAVKSARKPDRSVRGPVRACDGLAIMQRRRHTGVTVRYLLLTILLSISCTVMAEEEEAKTEEAPKEEAKAAHDRMREKMKKWKEKKAAE